VGLRWGKSLISGYQEIDEEHKELIRIANKLQKAIKLENEHKINLLLKEFATEVRAHFVSEEEVMKKHKYSYLNAHRKLHENYLNLLVDLIDTYHESKSLIELSSNYKVACNEMMKHIIHYDIPALQKMK